MMCGNAVMPGASMAQGHPKPLYRCCISAIAVFMWGCASSTSPWPEWRDATVEVLASGAQRVQPQAALPLETGVALDMPTLMVTAEAVGASREPDPPATQPDAALVQSNPSVWTLPKPATALSTLRAGWGMRDLPSHIQDEVTASWNRRRDFVARSWRRGARFVPMIVAELSRRQMPMEIALLPLLESGFQAQAVSSAAASGPWQFMRTTGNSYGLHDSRLANMRSDWLASTRAALDYLQKLHGMFGDWHLALAAYNWGEGNVKRALGQNLRLGLPQRFDALTMPAETRNYVPSLLALRAMVDQADTKNAITEESYIPDFSLTTPVLSLMTLRGRDIDVDRVARWADIRASDVRHLNPAVGIQPIIVASMMPVILLPTVAAARFERHALDASGARASYTAHVMGRNETLKDIARRVRLSVEELRALNHVPVGRNPKPGSTLLIPRSIHHTSEISLAVAQNAYIELTPALLKPPKRGGSRSATARKRAPGHRFVAGGVKPAEVRK